MNIISPSKPVTKIVARININSDGNIVYVYFPEKRDDFRALMKSLGYIWQYPYWQREIKSWTGDVLDRAAELGHHLLANNFCVSFPSEEVQDLALSASYEPEYKRWVLARTKGRYEGWFALWWRRSENCYSEAMKLSGAHYSKPCVVVPPEQFEEVLDFAEIHGFQFSEKALELLEKAQSWQETAMIVSIPEIKSVKPTNGKIKRPELEPDEDLEIDAELADDL